MTNPIQPNNIVSTDVEQISEFTGIDFNPTEIEIDFDSDRNKNDTDNNGNSSRNNGDNTNSDDIPYLIDDDISVENAETTKKYDYKPLKIEFVGGIYNGETIALGSNIQEYSTTQSANWGEKKGQKQRVGLEFNSVSPRGLSFTVEFYSPNQDVSPLVENLANLQKINGDTREPSKVNIEIGKATYLNAVCTQFSPKYDTPLPLAQGFRRATVSLEFKVGGGVGSVYQEAPPFATTALQVFAESQTRSQLRENSLAATRRRLIDCLEDEEDETYERLLAELTDDPSKIVDLPDNLFLQVSIAGLPNSVTSDDNYRRKLRDILAFEIVRRDLGEDKATLYASILKNNRNIEAIPESDRGFFAAYNEIYNGILNGNINNTVTSNSTQTLNEIGKCGRFMAESGGLKIVIPEKEVDNSWALDNFNQLLNDNSRNKVTDIELRKILQLPNNSQGDAILTQLKTAKVFSSKEEFIQQFGGLIIGDEEIPFNAYSAWSNVLAYDKDNLTKLNEYLATATDAKEIRDRFKGKESGFFGLSGTKKISESTAALLAGSNFESKEAFLKRIFELEQPGKDYSAKASLSNGNLYWHGFKRNENRSD